MLPLTIPLAEVPAEGGLYMGLGTVFIFAIFAVVFVVLNVAVISRILRPSAPSKAKETTYECGEPPVGSSWVRFDMRFYSVALIFLIFDVEVAVIYPWALVFKRLSAWGKEVSWASGAFAYEEMLFFVLVVGVGLVYVWAKGDLDWVKSVTVEEAKSGRGSVAGDRRSPTGNGSATAAPRVPTAAAAGPSTGSGERR